MPASSCGTTLHLRVTHRAIPHAAEGAVEIYINARYVYVNQATSTDRSFVQTCWVVASDDFRLREAEWRIHNGPRGRKARRSGVTRHTIRRVSWKSNNRDHGMQPWRVFSSFYRRNNKVLKNLISANEVIGNIFISEFRGPLQYDVSPKTQSGTVRLITILIISDFCKKRGFG